jgi:F-type H+-transporting ATPase subunit delta
MNSLRIARTALRVRPAALKTPLQRRNYADAVSDKVGTSVSGLPTLLTITDQT